LIFLPHPEKSGSLSHLKELRLGDWLQAPENLNPSVKIVSLSSPQAENKELRKSVQSAFRRGSAPLGKGERRREPEEQEQEKEKEKGKGKEKEKETEKKKEDLASPSSSESSLGSSAGKEELGLKLPSGMDVSGKNEIVVADSQNGRIVWVTREGESGWKKVREVGRVGQGEGEFKKPRDVAVNRKTKEILVADTFNHRIQIFDEEGVFKFAVGGRGKEPGEFNFPSGIAADESGAIYVCDTGNHRVQVFDEKGGFLREIRAKEGLMTPFGVDLFANGEVVVSENEKQRLSVFSPQGEFLRYLVQGAIKTPQWVFVDPQERVLVAENAAAAPSVLVLSAEGKVLERIGDGLFKSVYGVLVDLEGKVVASGKNAGGYSLFTLKL